MNFFTQILHLAGSGAVAYISALNMRDVQTRPNTLAGLQLAESGSVPFLETLSRRAAAEGDIWLSESLARHASDERRHGQIFAHALKQMGKQVIDFSQVAKSGQPTPTDRKSSPFAAAYFGGYSPASLKPEAIDWIVFFASTYILELDASKDFVRMANALPDADPQSANLKKGILSIAKDETGHAAYLREAMGRRLSPLAVEAAIDDWRSRKVNAMVSMVTGLVQKGGQFPTLVQEGMPSDAIEPEFDFAETEFSSKGLSQPAELVSSR